MSVSIDTTDVRLILPALRDVQARLLRAQGVTNGLLDLEGAEVDMVSLLREISEIQQAEYIGTEGLDRYQAKISGDYAANAVAMAVAFNELSAAHVYALQRWEETSDKDMAARHREEQVRCSSNAQPWTNLARQYLEFAADPAEMRGRLEASQTPIDNDARAHEIIGGNYTAMAARTGEWCDTLSGMALAAAARYCNKQAPDPDHLQGIKLAVDGGVERIATAIEYCEQVSAGVGNFPCTQVLLAPK